MENQNQYPAIAAFLRNGGEICIVRHGNATPKGNNRNRRLSEKGLAQAEATRKALEHEIFRDIGLVVSSSALRAMETVTDPDWPQPIPLNALYLPPPKSGMAKTLDRAFKRLGYQSLRTYHEDGMASDALKNWADNAAKAIEAEVAKASLHPNDAVVVGCYAIASAELACRMAFDADKLVDLDPALNADLGEAEVFMINSQASNVLYIDYLTAAELGHPVP